MMYPVLARCPVCGGELMVERLACGQCGTAVEGSFSMQRLARLTQDQWAFVELFLRCEGKLNRVQEELGLSYPTVRSRLNEVIQAMGYEVNPELEELAEGRQAVLDDLATGKIGVDEAVRMLKKVR